ncbi:MAG: NfeD family protein [Bacteroidales bacterium]|jgi:membrane protein implicated in regulation of membrane protease activity|nr:NfeD family protein [Bacteroidales bacterium]
MDLLQVWHLWLIVAVILVIIEVCTFTFVFLCFSVGCVAGAIVAGCGAGFGYQALAFAVITFGSFFIVRPLLLKTAFRKTDNVKTNADALVGCIGRVDETIDYQQNTGRVIVYGDNWKAVSENDEKIEKGEKIQVVRVDSTILVVKYLKKGE